MSGAWGCRGVGPCPLGVPRALLAGHRTPGFCAACRLCVAHGKPLPQPQFPRSKGGPGGSLGGFKRGTVLLSAWEVLCGDLPMATQYPL